MNDPFEIALAFTLRWEGGYSDHPTDPGGATHYGITQATYSKWLSKQGKPDAHVRNITMTEVRQIYYQEYWLKAGCDQTQPLPLAISVFDFAVNSGVGTALLFKEHTDNWVEYNSKRLAYLAALTNLWPTFGRGWANRVAALGEYAAAYDTPSPPQSGLVFQALGEHRLWVDNRPTLAKGMTMLTAALTRKPAVFTERVRVSRTRSDEGWKLDIAREE